MLCQREVLQPGTLFAARVQGGAHIVLNTLTSAGMVAASLATLAPGGAFVEISKRDIWSAARVAQGARAHAAAPCLLQSLCSPCLTTLCLLCRAH